MNAITITIGITCFNARESIERALESAQAQDWRNLEIIVVDDNSTDDSAAIVARVARQDDRIRLIQHERNRGCASARNTILNEASGEVLAYFDDDDFSYPERLRRQYQALMHREAETGSGLVACYGSRRVAFPDGSSRVVLAAASAQPVPTGEMVIDQILLDRRRPGYSFGELGSGTMMARVSTFHAVGGFDDRFRRSAEWDWAIRLALKGGEFVGVPEPLLTQNVTHTEDKASRKPLQYAHLLRRKHSSYLRQRGLYWFSHLIARAKFHYARGHRIRFRAALLGALLIDHRQLLLQRSEYRQATPPKNYASDR